MTHDLLKSVLVSLKAEVTRIVVTELKENTFYAVIFLSVNGKTVAVDSRPSDAIALALRTDTPIFVAEEVISKSRTFTSSSEKLDPEDIKKWLEGLSPEDLGKYKM